MGDRGRFVALEGGEGSGKSTQAARLAARLGAVLTREPGGTSTGERIRGLILDPDLPPIEQRCETLLLLAARAQHVAETIRPALDAGRDVVCDRFSGSTLAYQGYGRGLDPEELSWLSGWASGGLEPDLIVLLEVDHAEAGARRVARGRTDRIEGEGAEFFARVAAGFSQLAASAPGRWRVVDGTGSVEEVEARLWEAVSRWPG